MKQFDVLVIGAGPGGYIAAIRAAQLGFTVACCEANSYDDPKDEPRLGGTCLNVGCIPSKALLASSDEYEKISHLAEHGILVNNLGVDIRKMIARKNAIVTKMTAGIKFLFRKNKITLLHGHTSFVEKTSSLDQADQLYKLRLKHKASEEEILAKHVIIATGSKTRNLPGINIDNITICDNEGALNFLSLPKTIGIIGAGVIGLELGSVWRRLGVKVTILESMPNLLSACDSEVSVLAAKLFTKQGLDIKLGIKIEAVEKTADKVNIKYFDSENSIQNLSCDKLIVCVGRVPNTDGLNLAAIGLSADDRGFIPVDNNCLTASPNVYAIGDVVRGPMLAHKAEDEAVLVAEIIAGQLPHINYNCIPWVIYTAPEIAWVGKTEQQLQQESHPYKQGQFPFAANGRALGTGSPDGFIKILAHAKTDEILGVHIVGTNASELITEATLAMEFSASAEDIARTCHPHPSLSEVMREAALAATGDRALNM